MWILQIQRRGSVRARLARRAGRSGARVPPGPPAFFRPRWRGPSPPREHAAQDRRIDARGPRAPLDAGYVRVIISRRYARTQSARTHEVRGWRGRRRAAAPVRPDRRSRACVVRGPIEGLDLRHTLLAALRKQSAGAGRGIRYRGASTHVRTDERLKSLLADIARRGCLNEPSRASCAATSLKRRARTSSLSRSGAACLRGALTCRRCRSCWLPPARITGTAPYARRSQRLAQARYRVSLSLRVQARTEQPF